VSELTGRDKRAFLVGYMAGGSFSRKGEGEFESVEERLLQEWTGNTSYSDKEYLELQGLFIKEVLHITASHEKLVAMAQNEDVMMRLRRMMTDAPEDLQKVGKSLMDALQEAKDTEGEDEL
jgi:hypothetical protein